MTSKDQEKDNKSVLSISPEEFEFETRYVVLNFLGLVPAGSGGASLSASRGSSEGRRSSHLKETPGKKAPENGSGSGEWSSLHELPQMTLTDKIGRSHVPLDQFKPASVGDIRNYELKGGDEGENDFEGFDDDDTIYRPAGFKKKKKPPVSSDDEINIPVIKSLDYDDNEINKGPMENRIIGSVDTKYNTQDIDDQYKVYSLNEDGGSVPKDLEPQIGPPGNQEPTNVSKRTDIPRPSEPKTEGFSKRGDIPRPTFGGENGSSKKGGEDQNSSQMKGEEADSRTEDGEDVVDSAITFKDMRNSGPERPNTLENLVNQGPQPFRQQKKSKSPSKFNRSSLIRTPTYEGEKSDINREKSPLKRADSHRSPRPDFKSQLSGSSRLSDLSDMESLMTSIRSVSSRTSYVDVMHLSQHEVDSMVKKSVLPGNLKEEIEEELEELDEQYKSKGQLPVTPPPLSRSQSLSPESKVAQYLSSIGDRVQEKYGDHVNRAFERVFNLPTNNISYDDVKSAAGEMTQNTAGWTKVTLLLLLGKRLTWGLLSRDPSDNVVHNMTQYTTKLLEDQVADFIIQKGGWNSISELEPASEGSSPRILPEDDLEDGDPLNNRFRSLSDSLDPMGDRPNGSDDDEEDSPDLSSRSAAMITSVHSEASTLVEGKDRLDTVGMSRDTSSETLPSSLFSPTDSLNTNKTSEESPGNPELQTDSYLGDNNNGNIVKSDSKDRLGRIPFERVRSGETIGFSVGDTRESMTSIDYEDSGEDFTEGVLAAPPTPVEEFAVFDGSRHRQVEGTMDLEIIQQELRLLRQLSNQYELDSETERNKQFNIKFGLGLLGAAIVGLGAFLFLRYNKGSPKS